SCLFDIIDDYVFALPYHAYSSKSILPYWNSRKNYMGVKNSLWWDGGPVRFVEEVGIPCKYTDMVPCFSSNQIELC
ncbi:hypothetical protein pdam_00005610, partial [Pocillopora damicornis]